MARLTDAVQSALAQWWPLAMHAGYSGYTSTDTVSAASDLANQYGQSISFSEGSSIATLFGYARRMSNAADNVQSASEPAVASLSRYPPRDARGRKARGFDGR